MALALYSQPDNLPVDTESKLESLDQSNVNEVFKHTCVDIEDNTMKTPKDLNIQTDESTVKTVKQEDS